MADVFDIDSGNQMDYHGQRSKIDNYIRQSPSGWIPADNNQRKRRDYRGDNDFNNKKFYDQLGMSASPRNRNRSDQYRRSTSPRRMSSERDGWHSPQRMQEQQQQQMYSQSSMPPQGYSQPMPQAYSHEQHYATAYPPSATGMSYQQQGYGYGQQANSGFGQYGYLPPPPPPGYSGQPPAPPGTEYPSGWAPVSSAAYQNQEMQHINNPPPPSSTPDANKDNSKKEAAIANEMKQQQATLIKQRDEYFRKASVLRRELEKLRIQKHELLSDKSPPRDGERIMRENAKLQFEIQTKLKSIHNVVDMLTGIIGDGMKMKEKEDDTKNSIDSGSPKENRSVSNENDNRSKSDRGDGAYNYIHYDPELHWCRICDVFPRSAKDYLNHLHSPEHKQATQQHQLVDTPWHKLPADEELPSHKGAPVKRLPIKGLQFFISAPAWYCKLCDTWIGDLHCASIHLKSKNHAHNYSNFVEQNPHWEINWIKDREKAFERCGKLKLHEESDLLTPPEPPHLQDKHKKHSKSKYDFYLDGSKDKKKKKKSKKRKKKESSGSSSSSTSSDSSSEEDDKSKSIRVAMRNKMRMQAQLILKEEMEGKLEVLSKLVEDDRRHKEREKQNHADERQERQRQDDTSKTEDNIINQWMTVSNSNNDKQLLEGLKGRLKQRQELEKERAEHAAAEQRKQERLREERKLKEIREREQREKEARFKEEREREERERMKEKERMMRRKDRSSSSSPDRRRHTRSRSRSSDRFSTKRMQERNYRNKNERRNSPVPAYKTRTEEDKNVYESHFEKQAAESAKRKNTQNKKLPFIGRMPLLKKKKSENDSNDRSQKDKGSPKKEDYEVRLTKFEPLGSVAAFIPPPGVVHLPRIVAPPTQMYRVSAEPPPPPKIIPEPPKISEDNEEEEAPPPPNITMNVPIEVDEEEMQAPPPAPDLDAKPKGGHLPRDFQDALNIIYPTDQRPDMMQDPNLMMQYQYSMGYGMMYPGAMQMYDYTVQDQIMSNETNEVPVPIPQTDIPEAPPPPPASNDDDLAMLGIDAGDMAAQTI